MSLKSAIWKWEGKRVLVVGDLILDTYHFGGTSRLAAEAPVPVFVTKESRTSDGGAGLVAEQAAALGGSVDLFAPYQVSQKTRFYMGNHLMFRHDADVIADPGWCSLDNLSAHVDMADAVILSDYAKGALTQEICQHVIRRVDGRCPVVVDPKAPTWEKYEGATVICPNQHEMDLWLSHRTMWDGVILQKRGAEGLRVHHMETHFEDYPTEAKLVHDVTGAGDIVVAITALGLAAGASWGEICTLANKAAGWSVGQIGTAICDLRTLRSLL